MRQKYRDAQVFLVTSPSVSDAEPQGRDARTNVTTAIDAVIARRRGAGDAKVYAVTPPVALPSELTECDGHGSPEFHQHVANDLAPVVREKTGW